MRVNTSSSPSWAKLNVNGINYTMSNIGSGDWQYSFYGFSNNVSVYDYKVYTSNSNLGTRKFTYYPDYNGSPFSAFSFMALIFSFITLITGYKILK